MVYKDSREVFQGNHEYAYSSKGIKIQHIIGNESKRGRKKKRIGAYFQHFGILLTDSAELVVAHENIGYVVYRGVKWSCTGNYPQEPDSGEKLERCCKFQGNSPASCQIASCKLFPLQLLSSSSIVYFFFLFFSFFPFPLFLLFLFLTLLFSFFLFSLFLFYSCFFFHSSSSKYIFPPSSHLWNFFYSFLISIFFFAPLLLVISYRENKREAYFASMFLLL